MANAAVEVWREQYNELKAMAIANSQAKQIHGTFTNFYPQGQFIRFDALKSEDYPHNIADNSIFLEFSINFLEQKVEIFRVGHIYLSPSDKQTERYKYLCMKSMTNVHLDYGNKKFRKCKFKNMTDLFNKMETYFREVMKSVERYTDGYPYKEGVH